MIEWDARLCLLDDGGVVLRQLLDNSLRAGALPRLRRQFCRQHICPLLPVGALRSITSYATY